MNIKEQILNEIEGLKNNTPPILSWGRGYIKACDEIRDFINALPETKYTITYDVEQEIKKLYERVENPNFLDYQSFSKLAHHFIDWQKEQPVYVVTRCEEHDDYVEKVFLDENKAAEYCRQFEGNENEYSRHFTKMNTTR